MNKETESLLAYAIQLDEYERKQIISILIASMLTEISNEEAKNRYDNIVNTLKINI